MKCGGGKVGKELRKEGNKEWTKEPMNGEINLQIEVKDTGK